MTNTKSVNLSIGSRIISHLGEALIENEKVALLELIKNASDADANTCTVTIDTAYKSEYGEGRIVIEDDGSGMNLFIIENGFLKIATSIKQRYQKISPKFKRLAQGNKGIGRLALNQLGEYLIVTTKLDTSLINDDQLINDQKIVDVYGNRDRKELYAENLNVYYEFSINWKKYENEEGPVESVPIELETKDDYTKIFQHKKSHGTRIEVLGLKGLSFWKNPKVSKELESDVLAFLNPYLAEKVNFRVLIDLDGQKFRSNLYDKTYINQVCDSAFTFSFEQDTKEFSYSIVRSKKYIIRKVDELLSLMDKYDFDLVNPDIDYDHFYEMFLRVSKCFLIDRVNNVHKNLTQSKVDDIYTYTSDEYSDNIYLPGSFNGEFYGFDFGTGVIAPDVKKLISNIIGIKLYRNNFRIFPYGDNSNDWLGMSNYNQRYKSVVFKTHTTTGFVDINGETNLDLLEELTNRQGLVLDIYGANFLTIMQEIIYKSAAIEDGRLTDYFAFNRKAVRDVLPESIITIAGLEFRKRKNYRKEASEKVRNVGEKIGDIKVKAENPTLLSSDDIENISKELQKDVADLKNDLESIEKEFTNKELQVEDQNKYIADMYPIIGASIISETLAHEIIRLSNNIKSYTTSIRGALGRSDKDGVNLNIKLIESDIKFLARYASLLDVNSYSKRRRFDKLWVAKSIDEIVKDSPLLEYKETKINYILSGSDFESTLVKDSFKIIIENFLINSAYWLERYSIRKPSIHFDFNGRKKQLIIYDNGIGISKDIAKRIFEPFVTNKPSGDGRGMGLYIVNNLLNEIGATIDLSEKQNENGNLYQFIITFPEDE
jgi:signal transduction histidine kinase